MPPVRIERRRCLGVPGRDGARGDRETPRREPRTLSFPRHGSQGPASERIAAHVVASSPVACVAERRANSTKCREASLSFEDGLVRSDEPL